MERQFAEFSLKTNELINSSEVFLVFFWGWPERRRSSHFLKVLTKFTSITANVKSALPTCVLLIIMCWLLLLFSCYIISHSFVSPRAVVYQAFQCAGFPRQEYRSGLPFPFPGDLPDQRSNLSLLHWQVGFVCLFVLLWEWSLWKPKFTEAKAERKVEFVRHDLWLHFLVPFLSWPLHLFLLTTVVSI